MPVTKVEGGTPRGRRPTALVDQVSLLARVTVGTYALLGLALVALLASSRLTFEPRLRDAIEGTRVLRVGHEAMLDQQTGLRSFMLTGDDRFLEAYEAGRQSLEQLTAESDRRLGGGATAPLYLDLRLARQAWIDGWTADALGEGRRLAAGVADDERSLLLLQGKDLFDLYREAYESLAVFVVAERETALDAQSRAIFVTAGTALLATVALGSVAAARIRRLRLAVAGPMASILDHLDQIREGNLEAERPPYDGLSEFTTIDDGLSATAIALRHARAEAAEGAASVARQNEQLAEVLRFALEVAGSFNLLYVLRGLCTAVAAIAGGHRVVVWLRDPGADQMEAVADSGHPMLEAVALGPIGLGDGAVGRAARFARMEGLGRGPLDGRTASDELAIPMVVGAEVAGVLQLTGPGVGGLPVDTVDILEALAVQAASAVGAARLHEHTEVLAMSDALTRLPNRRRLEIDLAAEVSISSRHGRPLGFAMIDV
ncbi:MAG: CHASE3 domain-containing protein, partial [Acidimicrobiales bacterium]